MDELIRLLDGYTVTPDVDGWAVLLSLLLSFVLGQVLAWVYYFTHSNLSYSKSFVQSLIIITIVTSLVMTTISGSFVIAVGLMGALSLIRFRNIIKDTRDITFLFCAVVLGMACGAQRYSIAIIGTVGLCLVLLYLHWADFGVYHSSKAFLRFSLRGSLDEHHAIVRTLKRFCRNVTLVSSNSSGFDDSRVEYAYQLSLRSTARNEAFLSEIRSIEGVHNVSLTLQEQLLEM